jgi:hypothetical protein
MATATGSKPDEIQEKWFSLTQVYRWTLKHPNVRAAANVFLPDFDVRDAGASYRGVETAWAAALSAWGMEHRLPGSTSTRGRSHGVR